MWKGTEKEKSFVEADELLRVVEFEFGNFDEQLVDSGDVFGFEVILGGFKFGKEVIADI